MILVEHDMHMVMDIADRVMVLDFGQVDRHRASPTRCRATPRSSRPTSGQAS